MGADKPAAEACRILGLTLGTTSERIDFLRRGAELMQAGPSVLCSLYLLGSLWEARDFGALAGAARHLLDIMPAIGEAHLALARVADQEGDTESLVEHFAYAMAYTDQPRLPHVGALDWGSMIERSGARAETRAIELLGEHVFQLNEQQSSPEEGVLPGLPLIEALDRIAKYNSRGTISARTVHALRWASERAWDRDDLRTVVVARQHVCALLDRAGPEERGRLAIEFGWLATLLKQEGRLNEAESLYQQAIVIGTGHVESVEMSSLIGRYGNLLHETGSYEAAVEIQWRAVCVRRGVEEPYPLTVPKMHELLGPQLVEGEDLVGGASSRQISPTA